MHADNEMAHAKVHENVETDKLILYQAIGNVNLLLVQFLTSVVSAVSTSEGELSSHIKKVRIYFILCLLLFCKIPKQPTPIHNILADAVEVCSGSRKLLKILNRLGCTSSSDTHDRFVTQHAQARRSTDVWGPFTIASVDNIDILKSHSAVYCGD